MSQAKERPILFSGPMVRAIVNGRKTVTRRPVKAWQQPSQQDDGTWFATAQRHQRWGFGVSGGDAPSCAAELASSGVCPYGRPGDRLWVREAWAQINVAQAPGESWVVYRECDNRTDYGGPWKPSIHMRRRDSRILLEITNVRVERLQDITPSQCIAEGAWREEDKELGRGHEAVEAFTSLWRATGGDWDANPWVWVVEFKVIQPAPAGCDCHGSHFGAPYPDAQCVDGYLWDEDSCDLPGGPLMSGGDIPCPKCNAEAYADHQREMSQ